MGIEELLECTPYEVVISICNNKSKLELIKPSGELPVGWTLHVNPDSKNAADFEFDSLDEAGEKMLWVLWKEGW